MKVEASLVKSFSKDINGGNPAGVVLNADNLTDQQMLGITRELGFSESAFVQKSEVADYKVRFFATTHEVDFCGHAVVATFHVLAQAGLIDTKDDAPVTVVQETRAGILPVICRADGKVTMTQGEPIFGVVETDRTAIAKLLRIDNNDLADLPIQVVATAAPKLIVPLKSLDILRKVRPDLLGIKEYSHNHDGKGIYAFTTENLSSSADLTTRFFNPLFGINEESATGVAAGALGAYVNKYIFDGSKKSIIVTQGFDMGQDSTLYVDVSGTIQVSGYAITYATKSFEL